MLRTALFLFLFALLFAACEKEITVDLPVEAPQLVVEGFVEPGLPPFVLLTRTQGYFEGLDPATLAGVYVRDAVVSVDRGDGPVVLDQLCTASLTEEQRALIVTITGLDPDLLAQVDICLYTTTNTALFGEVGRTYRLRIESGTEVLTSSSTHSEHERAPATAGAFVWTRRVAASGYG